MAEINTHPAAQAPTAPIQPMNNAVADMNTAKNQIDTASGDTAAARIPDGLFTDKTNQTVTNTREADQRLPFLTRQAQAGVSYLELFSAVPLIFSSLISQAETIVAEENDHANSRLISFLTTSVKSLSSMFRWGFNQLVPKAANEDDVTVNKHPFLLDKIFARISQPAFVRQVTAFIFAMRRALFSFIPNVLTVPAEEHDPSKPNGGTVSGFKTSVFTGASALLSPFRVVSSLLTAAFALPSSAFGAAFAYTGDQKPFEFTNFTSRVADCLLPVTTNLNSFYKVTKAYYDSWSSNMHIGLAFDRYNINLLHVIQGVLGSIISVPYFFGALTRVKDILLEKDTNHIFILANKARDFIGAVALELESLGWLRGSVASTQEQVQKFITKSLEYMQAFSDDSVTKLMNANPIFKSFFSKFRPTNISGRVVSGDSTDIVESSNAKDNYVLNLFKKSEFFNEMFELLHPIQSALMLLPNAVVGFSDAYIQDNGTKYIRWLDRLVGVNSALLSLPNYFIYFFKTRAPQICLKWFEMKQRKADIEGRSYDAAIALRENIKTLKESKLPGTNYIATTLERLNIQDSDFRNPLSIQLKFDELDKEAVKHEHSVKASELVMAMRIGLRHLISTQNKLFFAQRDPITGFTAEEQAKDNAYKSIGKFGELVRGVPVVGLFAAPLVDMFKSMYKVKPITGRKILGGVKPSAAVAA